MSESMWRKVLDHLFFNKYKVCQNRCGVWSRLIYSLINTKYNLYYYLILIFKKDKL